MLGIQPVPVMAAAALSGVLAMACEGIAEKTGRRPAAFLLLKPLTTALTAASLYAGGGAPPPALVAAFALAMVGDIALMFDGEPAFLAGLGSFFLAHVALVRVFLHGATSYRLPPWTAGVGVYVAVFFAWLLPRTGALKWPTLAYGAVLAGMVLAAAVAERGHADVETRLALLGSLVFALSDSALAVRQFVGPYRLAQPLILASYWLAMGCIAASRWPAAAL